MRIRGKLYVNGRNEWDFYCVQEIRRETPRPKSIKVWTSTEIPKRIQVIFFTITAPVYFENSVSEQCRIRNAIKTNTFCDILNVRSDFRSDGFNTVLSDDLVKYSSNTLCLPLALNLLHFIYYLCKKTYLFSHPNSMSFGSFYLFHFYEYR